MVVRRSLQVAAVAEPGSRSMVARAVATPGRDALVAGRRAGGRARAPGHHRSQAASARSEPPMIRRGFWLADRRGPRRHRLPPGQRLASTLSGQPKSAGRGRHRGRPPDGGCCLPRQGVALVQATPRRLALGGVAPGRGVRTNAGARGWQQPGSCGMCATAWQSIGICIAGSQSPSGQAVPSKRRRSRRRPSGRRPSERTLLEAQTLEAQWRPDLVRGTPAGPPRALIESAGPRLPLAGPCQREGWP